MLDPKQNNRSGENRDYDYFIAGLAFLSGPLPSKVLLRSGGNGSSGGVGSWRNR